MKKVSIKSSDYELYKIAVPWKKFFSPGKNFFIIGELEKRHPCFSGNSCFDTSYSLSRRGLFARVVVMEKSSLSDYTNPGARLFLEGVKGRAVFEEKKAVRTGLLFLLLFLSLFLALRIYKNFGVEKEKNLKVQEDNFMIEESSQNRIKLEKSALMAPQSLIPAVFASVSKRGGKISDFNFSRSSGESSFSIYGCNSEDVVNARFCVVSFKNNEPHFTLQLPFEKRTFRQEMDYSIPSFSELSSEESEKRGMQLANLRAALMAHGISIEKEKNSPHMAEISFFLKAEHLFTALKISSQECEKALWTVENLEIKENGKNFSVKISFLKGEGQDDFKPLDLCALYAYLFTPESQLVPKVKALFAPKKSSLKSLVPSDREKIGEIRRKDGTSWICYKNPDGKTHIERKVSGND